MAREKPSRSAPKGKTPTRTTKHHAPPSPEQVRIADLLDRIWKIENLLYAPIAVLTRREDGRIGRKNRRDVLAMLRRVMELAGGPRYSVDDKGRVFRVSPPRPL